MALWKKVASLAVMSLKGLRQSFVSLNYLFKLWMSHIGSILTKAAKIFIERVTPFLNVFTIFIHCGIPLSHLLDVYF